MSEEKKFAEGLYFNEPREGSPEWILGSISVEPKRFTDWMRANYDKNEKYLKIDIKMGKSGKPYTELNTWKPNQGGQSPNNAPQGQQSPSQGNNGSAASFKSDTFDEQIPF